MPIEVEIEGKKTTVYTQEDLTKATADTEAKYAGYIPGDKLEAEKNTAAAAARKRAEEEKATIANDLEKLRTQLENAKGNDAKIAELNTKIADLELAKGNTEKQYKLSLALLKAGANKDYIDDLMDSKAAKTLDPNDDKFAEAIENLKQSKPLFFAEIGATEGNGKTEEQKKRASGGAGGSMSGSTSKYTVADLATLSRAEMMELEKSGELNKILLGK
jgi:hypothetical protein